MACLQWFYEGSITLNLGAGDNVITDPVSQAQAVKYNESTCTLVICYTALPYCNTATAPPRHPCVLQDGKSRDEYSSRGGQKTMQGEVGDKANTVMALHARGLKLG